MTRLLQPSLTGGEVSPSLYGRVDTARYSVGLRRCRNFIVRPYGGVENRCGFKYVAVAGPTPTGASPGVSRVIPFVYSTETSYVIDMGNGYMRFLSGGAAILAATTAYNAGTTYTVNAYVTSVGITYRSLAGSNVGNTPASSPTWWIADASLQIAAPWTGSQVAEVRYTQSADVMYLTHPSHPPQELRRTSATLFTLAPYVSKEGPFRDVNTNESSLVSASAVTGIVTVTSNTAIFTANAVGSLFYLETKNLGQIKPWVVGDRGVTVGALRRSDGKTYKAVTVPATPPGGWIETGNRQPVHEDGRGWDGTGDTKTNGSQTWAVGVEWEYQDSGYGIVKITALTSSTVVTGEVQKQLPAQVVGGVGALANTWNLVGDGVTTVFAIAGATDGEFGVRISGVYIPSDPNYNPGPPIGGPDRNDSSGGSGTLIP